MRGSTEQQVMASKNRQRCALLWRGLLSGVLCVCVGTLHSLARTEVDTDKETRILRTKVESFAVHDMDIEEALRLLRRSDYAEILIGLEKMPHWWEGAETKPISLQLKDTTVGEILTKLCEADPRYTYEIIDDVLIHVYWKGAKDDPSNLLNMKIHNFTVHGNYTPAAVILKTSQLAPELRDHLREKKKQFNAQRGIVPASPGHNMRGNMTPEFHLELKDVTVREILNAIVLYSRRVYLERPPQPTGWRQPPTSWKYEFIIKPDAPTGLGGIPRWDVLN